MAIARLGRHGQAKRPYGFCAKMTAVAILGLCFICVWTLFSSSSSTTSVVARRESFDDIAEPIPGNSRVSNSGTKSSNKEVENHEKKVKSESGLEKRVNGSVSKSVNEHKHEKKRTKVVPHKKRENEKKKLPEKGTGGDDKPVESEEKEEEDSEKEKDEGDEEREVVDGKEEGLDREGEASEDGEGEGGLVETVDQENEGNLESDDGESKKGGKKKIKFKGPLFDPKMHYNWKLCSTRSKHNYIPCIDYETSSWRLQSYRHTERSCPKTPIMCLVPLPRDGYEVPVRWPESKEKVNAEFYTFISVNYLSMQKLWLSNVVSWYLLALYRYSIRMWHIQNLQHSLRNIVGWWNLESILLFPKTNPNSRVECFTTLSPLKR